MAGIHAGHRKRLRARARAVGLKGFQPHEVLELLLTQIIPLKDVNPLAHGLIDKFGSVEKTLTATVDELMQVDGIGLRSAQWLSAMGELAMAYSECWYAPRDIVTGSGQAIAYLQRRMHRRTGTFAIVCLDRTGRVLNDVALENGPDGFPRPREIVRLALLHHAAQVFSVHFAFSAQPDAREIEFARHVGDVLKMVEIAHLDHIVTANGSYYSARREGLIENRPIIEASAAERE